jgi:protease II
MWIWPRWLSPFVSINRYANDQRHVDGLLTIHLQVVLGGFKPENYVSSRIWAVSHDGTKVPITTVRRKDLPSGPQPVFLEGYGSYEISNDVFFSRNQLSLLDRGVVVAIAHVRGGGDLGRLWYAIRAVFLTQV